MSFYVKNSNTPKPTKKPNKHIRITVIGDGTTGKTCLLICYKDKRFESYYIPTVFDSYSMTVPIGNEEYTVILSDTAGQEEYDRLRPLAYPDTDAFLICYAVNNRDSYRNVESKWIPEIRHHKPHAKIILTCTKIDLRDDNGQPDLTDFMMTSDGDAVARKYKLNGFVECSSKKMLNVNHVFAEAIRAVVAPPKKRKPPATCAVL